MHASLRSSRYACAYAEPLPRCLCMRAQRHTHKCQWVFRALPRLIARPLFVERCTLHECMLQSLFPDASYNWLREASAGKRIRRMLLIADRCPKLPKNPPPTLCEPHDGWHVLEGQRTAGLVHCALMLFRTSLFLRVVICGTNLDGQLDRDRDSLFVQVRFGGCDRLDP